MGVVQSAILGCDNDYDSVCVPESLALPPTSVRFHKRIDLIGRVQLSADPPATCLAEAKYYAHVKMIEKVFVKWPARLRQLMEFPDVLLSRRPLEDDITSGDTPGIEFQLIQQMKNSRLHAILTRRFSLPTFIAISRPVGRFVQHPLSIIPYRFGTLRRAAGIQSENVQF